MKTNAHLLIYAILFISFVVIFQNTAKAQQYGWEEKVSGTNSTLEEVKFLNSTTGWVVGGNKGSLWEQQTSGISEQINKIFALDENNLWAAAYSGKILKTTNGGQNWVITTIPGNNLLRDIYFFDGLNGVAVGDGNFFKTSDGGNIWTSKYIGSSTLYSLFFIDNSNGWIVGYSGDIYHTTNGGTDWTEQTSGTTTTLYSICFMDSNNGIVVGGAGVILKTTNAGSSWESKTSGTTYDLNSIDFADLNNGWISADHAIILNTTDAGESWLVKQTSLWPPYDLADISFCDANTGYAVGVFGSVLYTSNGGTDWSSQSSGTTSWLNGVVCLNNYTTFAVGNSGRIIKTASGFVSKTTDGGNSWNKQICQTNQTLYSLSFVDANNGWVVGSSGKIFYSSDGGSSWTNQSSGLTSNLFSVNFEDINNGWAVGTSGKIINTTNGGLNWNTQTSGTSDELCSVDFFNLNKGWIAGAYGTVLSTTDGGTTWNAKYLTTKKLLCVKFINENIGWISGAEGNVFKTTNGGSNWTNQPTNITTDLYSINFVNEYTGWAIGSDGKILKTNNGGEIWVEQNSGVTQVLNSIYAIDATTCLAAGESGKILKTTSLTDYSSPSLSVSQPSINQIFTLQDLPVTVSGEASDENGVRVKVNDDYVTVNSPFQHNLYLPAGTQNIKVQAADAAGNVTSREFSVQININLPIGTIPYYLVGSGENQQLALSPSDPSTSYSYESYMGSMSVEFPVTLTGYLNGTTYQYKVRLASPGYKVIFMLSWYVERDTSRVLLAQTLFPVSSSTYSYYSGTVNAPAAIALPNEKIIFQVAAGKPGGVRWGNGSGGSAVWIPGGQDIPPTPPLLASPPDNAVAIHRDTLTLTWFRTPSATSYNVELALDSLFISASGMNNVEDTTCSFVGASYNTKYWWRVKANSASGQSGWSDVWSFTTEEFCRNMILLGGWNILSIPISLDDMSLPSIFPYAISNAYGYNNGYVTVTSFEYGKGYWLKYPNPDTITFCGYDISGSISLSSGWNIIGVFDVNLPVNEIYTNPTGILASSFYGYNNGYVIANTLEPGKGYWIKTNQEGSMNIPSLTKTKNPIDVKNEINKEWPKIELTDANGNRGVLFLSNNSANLDKYELPPLPPKGVFDFRFSSDRLVEELNAESKEIKISSADYPVKLKIVGTEIKVSDLLGGKIINVLLKDGESITINNSAIEVLRIEGKSVPAEFALYQNYPNPFNPVTKIKYDIPNLGQTKRYLVELMIYDILGNEVTTLVNEEQSVGIYEVTFNGSNISSGIYFCRLRCNAFTAIRKMIFTK